MSEARNEEGSAMERTDENGNQDLLVIRDEEEVMEAVSLVGGAGSPGTVPEETVHHPSEGQGTQSNFVIQAVLQASVREVDVPRSHSENNMDST
jgi:hypothetical protein